MKRLLLILAIVSTSTFAIAQSGTTTVDVTDSVGVTGGDHTGYIASVLWSMQSGPGTMLFSDATKLKTSITIDKIGDFYALLTIKDNLGNIATAVYHIVGTVKQGIFIKVTLTPIYITVSKP